MVLTGKHVRELREALRLDPFAFASVMGVHVSTTYRWENLERVVVDPLQYQILKRLWELRTHRYHLAETGEAVKRGLLSGGTLTGLAVLLRYLKTPVRKKPTRTARRRRAPPLP